MAIRVSSSVDPSIFCAMETTRFEHAWKAISRAVDFGAGDPRT